MKVYCVQFLRLKWKGTYSNAYYLSPLFNTIVRFNGTELFSVRKTLGLILFILSASLQGQIIRVVDQETDEPLEDVLFLMESPLKTAYSDGRGRADLSVFPEKGQVQIRLLGYHTQWTSISELRSLQQPLKMANSGDRLQQVVVSVNRWVQPRNEVPFKVRGLSAKEFSLYSPQTSADLLGQTGEVFIQKSQQGGGSPMIRGFAANRLLISVDGVRMNTAIFRSGNLQNVINVDPFFVENTEVLFGPGSVMYGSDAIGGVMNFYTLRPKYSTNDSLLTEVRAASRFSTANNEFSNHFDIRLGWKKWAAVFGVTHNEYGDMQMGSNGSDDYLRNWYVERQDSVDVVVPNEDPELQTPSRFSQTNYLFKLGFKPNEVSQLTYTLNQSSTTAFDRYDRLIETSDGLPRSAQWRYGPQLWSSHQLHYFYGKNTLLHDAVDIRLAYQRFEESRITRRFQNDNRSIREEAVDAYSLNMDYLKHFKSIGTVRYGAEFVWNDVNSVGRSEDIRTGEFSANDSRYPPSTWYSAALFATWQKNWEEKWTIQAGARYNWFGLESDFSSNQEFFPLPFESASLNDGALTGNIGAEWHVDEDWNISAHVSSAFRSPNVDDMGKIFDSEPGSVVVPNPDLKAEQAVTAEFDIDKKFGDWLDVDVAFYYTWLNDAMVRRPYSLNGQDSIIYEGELSQVQAIQNAAKANVWGIETRIEVKFSPELRWINSLNYQLGEEEVDGESSPLRHAAPMFGRSGLSYFNNDLRVDLYAFFSAERPYDEMPLEEIGKRHLYAADDLGRPYSPSWYTLNFKVDYRIISKLSAQIGIENITDQRYRPYSSGLAGAGRNFVFGLRWGI